MPKIKDFLTTKVVIHFDGACEPINPNGTMGLGVHIAKDGKVIHTHSESIRLGERNYTTTTNNLAEYLALRHALEWCIENGHTDVVSVFGDSKLVIEQMSNRWSAKNGAYVEVAKVCKRLKEHFSVIHFEWIPRELNTLADDLSKNHKF